MGLPSSSNCWTAAFSWSASSWAAVVTASVSHSSEPCRSVLAFSIAAAMAARALVLTFIGIPIIDLLGAAWYAVFAQIPLTTALLTTALPFLPGDIIKAVGAVLVYLPLRKALRQFSK